jgi:hypothetical protein
MGCDDLPSGPPRRVDTGHRHREPFGDMEWSTLLATLIGGALGLSSSMLVDRNRSRRDRREQWGRRRLEVYVDYLAELSRAYESLWALARGEYESTSRDAGATARLILRAGAIFQTRQRLLILSSQSVRAAGDVAFGDLMQLRSVVGTGAQPRSTGEIGTFSGVST